MQRITAAALQLLSEQGFTGLGVNAVAAAAGVDKQLIYYHFGGLDGVVRQLGPALQLWLGAPLPGRPGEAHASAMQRLLLEYAAALRGNPLVLRLLAWELEMPCAVLKDLETTRTAAMQPWAAALRSAAQPVPEGLDAAAINALLLAGLHYLALRVRASGSLAGSDITSAAGAARIGAALRLITERAYAGPAPGPAIKPALKPAPRPRQARS